MKDIKSPKLEFISDHHPFLEDGKYTVTVNQIVENTHIPTGWIPEKTVDFWVAGEQYSLDQKDIGQMFPPPGSVGDHSNVFPHILLNRSTLPWERHNGSDNKPAPWLALLLFTEEDMKDVEEEVSTIEKVGFTANTDIGQQPKDKLKIIKVKKTLLELLIPNPAELPLLSHVRQGTDENDKPIGNEKAVVICNRLPKKGEESAVHLVSLENYFAADLPGYKAVDDKMQLISLASWKFSCPDHYKVTAEAIERVYEKNFPEQFSSFLGKEFFKKEDFTNFLEKNNFHTEDEFIENFHFGTFKQTLLHLNRQPFSLQTTPKDENDHIDGGFVPLQHYFKDGAKSASWFHGPLSPKIMPQNNFDFPVLASDQLLLFDKQFGMYDVSYAAAWELGRLWALSNKRFSTELFMWKRKHKQHISAIEQDIFHDSGHLPSNSVHKSALDMPEIVQKGFEELSLLKGVPFNYLVPSEEMLPVESIRFFHVDSFWMECLYDGAFSIGRITSLDFEHDREQKRKRWHRQNSKDHGLGRSGFLMRSEVISGWPDLVIEGFARRRTSADSPLRLTQTRLSENVVLCLFDGALDHVNMHLKPESIHFGITMNQHNKFSKFLKDPVKTKIDIPFKDTESLVVDIYELAKEMSQSLKTTEEGSLSPLSSATFGYQMVEGIETIIFH
jgi:hypothetical protein